MTPTVARSMVPRELTRPSERNRRRPAVRATRPLEDRSSAPALVRLALRAEDALLRTLHLA